MSKTYYSFAPYNFFPFTERIRRSPEAYKDYESLPPHDRYVEDRLSGEISYRVTALQEMRIGGGEELNGIKTVFRDGRNRCVIPGSTMRGFVRSHAEMLSFSYPEMIADTRFSFRSFADKFASLRKQYAEMMKDRSDKENDDEKETIKNVKVGYLYCRKDASGHNRYYIVPVKEFGNTGCTCFKVHEASLQRAGVLRPENCMYKPETWKQNFGRRRIYPDLQNKLYIPYRRSDSIRFGYEDGKILRIGDTHAPLEGKLFNSSFIDGKKHHYLVSAFISDCGRAVEIDERLVDIYRREVEQNSKKFGRNDVPRDKRPEVQREIKRFYELPKDEKEPKELSDKGYAKKHGKLFFYRMEGDQVAGFGPTPFFRVAYRHSVAEGIQYEKPQGYDYVSAMFGFIGEQRSYKGRVFFQNAVEEGSSSVCEKTLITGSPRASAIQLYLQQNSDDAKQLITYNDANFALRGYKFYWKRKETIAPFDERSKSYQNNTVQFVRANSSFRGKIVFQNLSPEELGLLLLSIQYKNPADEEQPERFLLGGGKAYGYGLVELSDVKLSLYDLRKSFAEINPVSFDEGECGSAIEDYKRAFIDKIQTELQEKYGIGSYDDTATIRTYRRYSLMPLDGAEAYLSPYKTGYMGLRKDEVLASYGSKLPLQTADKLMDEWSV